MDATNYQAIRRSIINAQVERYLAKIEAARVTYAPCLHPCIECETSHAEPTAACDTSCDCFDWTCEAKRAAEDAPDALDRWLYAADLEGDVECGR